MPSTLKAIRQLSEALFQYTDVDEMIRQTLHAALDVIGADAGSVLLANAETKQLVFRYVVGETANALQGMGIPWDEGIAGAVFASGKPESLYGYRCAYGISISRYDRRAADAAWGKCWIERP